MYTKKDLPELYIYSVILPEIDRRTRRKDAQGGSLNIKTIQSYYKLRGLQWPDAKDALWFFLSEVGELAEAYLVHHEKELSEEEIQMLSLFTKEGLHADEIVSRVEGWVRNNDRVRKEDINKEVADCEMMLAVFMYSLAGSTPDDALLIKMQEKLGDQAGLLE